MNIAFIGQKGIPARFGGIEAHVEALATRLAARGHRVDVYVRNWYTQPDVTEFQGVTLKHSATIRTKHLDAAVHSLLATVEALQGRYDLLHFHAIGPGSFSFLARMLGRKSILTVHGLDWRRAKWSWPARLLMRTGEAVAVRSATRIVVVSSELEDYIQSRYHRAAHLIPNGVDPPLEDPGDEALEQLQLIREEYLLFLGRFVPEKRIEWLIDGVRRIAETGDRVPLVLAGGGDHEDVYIRALEKRAKDLPCVFTGYVGGKKKEALLRRARLVVLPSSLEGLPIVLLEAMARGRVCLASDLPPHRELLGDGRGFLFERDDFETFVAQLGEILRLGSAKMKEIGDRARDYVERNHDWDRIASTTENLYQQCVGGSREP